MPPRPGPTRASFTVAARSIRAAAALAPIRPAWAAGLRGALATIVPILVAGALHLGDAGTWMTLGGFNAALADRGGVYRTRAATMAAVTLAGAIATILGMASGMRLGVAVPLTFAVGVATSLGRVWGSGGATIGGTALSVFGIALSLPSASPRALLTAAAFVLLGGAWAMLLALVLWPLRPYRPVRLAVSAVYRALGTYTDDVAGRLAAETPSDAPAPASAAPLRGAIEDARAALALTRRGRPGETDRGERFVVLHEIADQLFGHLLALLDIVESIPRAARDHAAQTVLVAILDDVADTARAVADAIEVEEGTPAVTVAWNGQALRHALPDRMAGDDAPPAESARAHYLHAAQVVDRLAQYARVGAANASALNGGGELPGVATADPLERIEAEERPPLLAPFRDVFAHRSLVLRHALRVGIVTAATVWLVAALHLERGYWAIITVAIILQPYTGATTLKAFQRVLGTVLGGVIAAGLGAVIHDPRGILLLAFVLVTMCVAMLPVNYAAYSVFLTPTFVLLAEVGANDWHLAGVRVLDTVVGGALALLGAYLLWPSPHWSRLPIHLADALRADRDYLRRAVALYGDRGESAGHALRAERRRAGLAVLNAEESFQRLLGEHGGAPEALGAPMSILTYVRRLAGAIAALAVVRHSVRGAAPPALEPFARDAERVLDDLADALVDGRAPAPVPEGLGEGDAGSPLLRARIDRIARQLETLHDAVGRWATRGRTSSALGPSAVGPSAPASSGSTA